MYVASLKRKRESGREGRPAVGGATLAQCKRLKLQADMALGDQVRRRAGENYFFQVLFSKF